MRATTFWVPGTRHSTPAVITARTLQCISLYRWERLGTWDASADGRRNNSRVSSFSVKGPIKEQKIFILSLGSQIKAVWRPAGWTLFPWDPLSQGTEISGFRGIFEKLEDRLNYMEIEFSIELQRSCHDQGSFALFLFVLHFPILSLLHSFPLQSLSFLPLPSPPLYFLLLVLFHLLLPFLPLPWIPGERIEMAHIVSWVRS